MKAKVLLVDDHKILRQGLKLLLENQSELQVIGQAEDGAEAIVLVDQLKPDVIVMDVSMPGLDGIEATRQIVSQYPDMKIIALSMYPKKHFVVEMLKAGASGYVLKEYAFSELIKAIDVTISGQVYLCSKTTSIVVGDYVNKGQITDSFDQASLTDRQSEILKFVADGMSSKEIAYSMDISVKTVDATRRKIMKKLDIDSVADLVKYAVREGLSPLEV
jgi:two-component system response regulator NreC